MPSEEEKYLIVIHAFKLTAFLFKAPNEICAVIL